MSIYNNRTVSNILNNRYVKKSIANFTNPTAMAPVVALEATVIAGRCYHSHLRDKELQKNENLPKNYHLELKERLFEETLGAIFWFGGITGINAIIDKACKTKKVDLPEIATTDIACIKNLDVSAERKNLLTKVKFAKTMFSAVAAFFIVGNIVPKIKNHITERYIKTDCKDLMANKKIETEPSEDVVQFQHNNQSLSQSNSTYAGRIRTQKVNPMQDYLSKTQKQPVSFGASNKIVNVMETIAHNLETNNVAKLLTLDMAIAIGRAANSRSDDEKSEVYIRDLGSAPFYTLTTPALAWAMAKLLNKNNTNLDPNVADYLSQKALELHADKKLSKTNLLSAENLERAKGISSIVGDEDMLKAFYNGSLDSLDIAEKGLNDKNKFRCEKKLANLNKEITNYSDKLFKRIANIKQGETIADVITELKNKNNLKKLGFTMTGLAISALFLSTLIPVFQNWFTKRKHPDQAGAPGINAARVKTLA